MSLTPNFMFLCLASRTSRVWTEKTVRDEMGLRNGGGGGMG